MKNLHQYTIAHQSVANQIVGSFNGFTAEVCLREESLCTAFRLRYRSYLAVKAIRANQEQLLYDDYDFLPNSRIFLIWFDDKPVATVRSCIYSDTYQWMPTEGIKYFTKEFVAKIGDKKRILESNRFAVDPDFQGRQSLFAQLLLFRTHGLNAGYHNCSHIITLVRGNHRAFYLRFLGMRSISDEPRYVPWVDANVFPLVNDAASCLQAVAKRGMPTYDNQDIVRYGLRAQLDQSLGQIAA